MDDTIADFTGSLIDKISKKINIDIKHDLYNENKDFIHPLVHPKYKNIALEIYKSENFFFELQPITGSIENIMKLMQKYDVFFCSSPTNKNENSIRDKYKWINKYFGKEHTKKIICTKDKTLIYGDILIDDKVLITGVMKPMWKHIVMNTLDNYDIDLTGLNKQRLNSWNDIISVLEQYEK